MHDRAVTGRRRVELGRGEGVGRSMVDWMRRGSGGGVERGGGGRGREGLPQLSHCHLLAHLPAYLFSDVLSDLIEMRMSIRILRAVLKDGEN